MTFLTLPSGSIINVALIERCDPQTDTALNRQSHTVLVRYASGYEERYVGEDGESIIAFVEANAYRREDA